MDFPSFLEHVPQLVLVSVQWLWMPMPIAQDRKAPGATSSAVKIRYNARFPATFSLLHPRLLEARAQTRGLRTVRNKYLPVR